MKNKLNGAMLILSIAPIFVFGQYKNNKWLSGYETFNSSPPWNGSKIEFMPNNSLNISFAPRSMWFHVVFSGLSDQNDTWFFYTNGAAVCNKNNDTIANGFGLSPGGDPYWDLGYSGINLAVILPKKVNGDQLYILHQNKNPNTSPQNLPRAFTTFYSVIEPYIGPKGTLVQKNTVLIDDTTEMGNVSPCRHANGRDWWLLIKKFNSNIYYTVLLGPDGPITIFQQNVPGPTSVIGGQSCFSPNGEHFAVFSASSQLRLYDFDRCSGLLSNYKYKHICNGIAGACSFSPNSRFLYINKIDTLWQFDMQAADVLTSQQIVGVYDGHIDSNGYYSIFTYQWLGPDGKIYMTSNPSALVHHVINKPDLLGTACDLQQHAIQIPTYTIATTPSTVNLNLKQVHSSPCDTLGVGNEELKTNNLQLKIAPNPSNGKINIEFPVQEISGILYVYDVNGKLVYREYVSPYTYIKNINLQGKLSSGMYALSMVFGEQRFLGKMVVN
jgi:hypothetical protein